MPKLITHLTVIFCLFVGIVTTGTMAHELLHWAFGGFHKIEQICFLGYYPYDGTTASGWIAQWRNPPASWEEPVCIIAGLLVTMILVHTVLGWFLTNLIKE